MTASLMVKPPGSTAPGSAQGTLSPTWQFGAPQTICRKVPSPASTCVTLSRSAPGCGTASMILATTIFSDVMPLDLMPSTSTPANVSRSSMSVSGLPARSRCVPSQLSEMFMGIAGWVNRQDAKSAKDSMVHDSLN